MISQDQEAEPVPPSTRSVWLSRMGAIGLVSYLVALGAFVLSWARARTGQNCASPVNLIVDTDLFSDVDDTAALLLAATQPCSNLLAVQINYPSMYSVLAASSILTHYGLPSVPVGTVKPLTNETFFDAYFYQYGEYASKVQYHWNRTLANASDAWDAVDLYRKTLSGQDDGSVTIASIGFFDNLSGLLNSTADQYSPLDGLDLVKRKVKDLVIMGGEYPSGWEFNFGGYSPLMTRHVVSSWPGKMTFSGSSLGMSVSTGARLSTEGLKSDPVVAAYQWYNGYNESRFSWDPLTIYYALHGLDDVLTSGNTGGTGYNMVLANGSNSWIYDGVDHGQTWLKVADGVSNETIADRLDNAYLTGVNDQL